MNYDLSESHRILQAEMGKFCSEEIAPGAALLDEVPREEAAARMRNNLKKIAGAGGMDLLLGDDLLGRCIAGEELARACPSTFLTTMTSATAFGRVESFA